MNREGLIEAVIAACHEYTGSMVDQGTVPVKWLPAKLQQACAKAVLIEEVQGVLREWRKHGCQGTEKQIIRECLAKRRDAGQYSCGVATYYAIKDRWLRSDQQLAWLMDGREGNGGNNPISVQAGTAALRRWNEQRAKRRTDAASKGV
jgi:hypothetical protein